MAISNVETGSIRTRGATMANDPQLVDMMRDAITTFANGNHSHTTISTGAEDTGWPVGTANGIVKGETGKAARWLASESAADIVKELNTMDVRPVWGTTGKAPGVELEDGHKAVTLRLVPNK
jgi:hypothetical protein